MVRWDRNMVHRDRNMVHWDRKKKVHMNWHWREAGTHIGRLRILAVATAFVVGVAAGCDWRDFDKLSDDAPVRSVGTPDGLDGYSASAVSVRLDGDANDRQNTVVIAGFGTEAIVSISVRSNGRAGRRSGGSSFDPDNEPAEVSSVVQLDATGAANPEPTFLAGSAEGNKIHVIRIPDSGHFVTEVTIDGPIAWSRFGGAVGTGDLGDVMGQGVGQEWIVTSDDDIYILYGDPKSAAQSVQCDARCSGATCTAMGSDRRSIVVGGFFDDLAVNPDAVAVGTPDEGGGRVHFLRWVPVAPVSPGCSDAGLVRIRLEAPAEVPNPSEMFGTALHVKDLDGDGRDDLLVGAPDLNRVYVYLNETGDPTGWANAQPDGVIEPPDPDNAVAFGSSMTFVDVDGDGTQELAVGDPEGYVGGTRGAGRVHIFSWDAIGGNVTATEQATAYDFQPESTGGLGIALAAIVMGDTDWIRGMPEELVVVGYKETYIFFLTGMEGDHDPR